MSRSVIAYELSIQMLIVASMPFFIVYDLP